MPPTSPNASPWATLIPIVIAMGLVILRNSRARRVRIEAMWVAPVIIVALIGFALWGEGKASAGLGRGPQFTPVSIGLDAAGLIVGALLGWWRARFTNITIDPATHELTSRASPIGMVVILGILVIRTAVRAYAAQNASALGEWAGPITDALLVMSLGLVCAQRLEIYLRASHLLAEARANAPPPQS
ncbi:hypothetical protein [Phenylobacterium sp.]|jgi:hypothetical protein|uniref:hypothetical protein n=1 Tax=Phenylobacterium sp. TaxID=1871053 RepID=UPI002F42E68D